MMNKIKRAFRCGISLLSVLALLSGLGLSVSAAADGASLDLTKTGSVTLELADGDGNTVSGGKITIYQVAELYFNDGDMAYRYTDDFDGCSATLDVTDTSLAATLAAYVRNKGISGTTSSVSSKGKVTFSGLSLGLYLLVQTTASENYETISPFVVTVPYESDGAWVYEVDASPKVGTVTRKVPDEPDKPPRPKKKTSESSSTTTVSVTYASTLPQTGQLNWPVPVLACCGMLLFALGWAMRMSGRKEQDV